MSRARGSTLWVLAFTTWFLHLVLHISSATCEINGAGGETLEDECRHDDTFDDLSLLQTAHGALAESKPGQSKTDVPNYCVQGNLVPQLYLLGAPKSGTTSAAQDFHDAGIGYFLGKKECKFFDNILFAGDTLCGPTDKYFQNWLQLASACPTDSKHAVVGDFTVTNAMHVNAPDGYVVEYDKPYISSVNCLPQTLNNWYAGMAPGLQFILMYREPLSALQSQQYFINQGLGIPLPPGQFDSMVLGFLKQAQSGFIPRNLWIVMYGAHLNEWLKTFSASQFYIIPYLYYSNGGRCEVFEYIGTRIGLNLPCAEQEEATNVNPSEHPPLDEDISNSTSALFYQFMNPYTMLLTSLIANGSLYDMGLISFNGTLGSQTSVSAWLDGGW